MGEGGGGGLCSLLSFFISCSFVGSARFGRKQLLVSLVFFSLAQLWERGVLCLDGVAALGSGAPFSDQLVLLQSPCC